MEEIQKKIEELSVCTDIYTQARLLRETQKLIVDNNVSSDVLDVLFDDYKLHKTISHQNIFEYLTENINHDFQASGSDDVYLVHGCNTMDKMGGGFAAQVSRLYPSAVQADIESDSIPGRYSFAKLNMNQTVINAYTQIYPGNARGLVKTVNGVRRFDTIETREDLIRDSLIMIREEFTPGTIYLPLIGAGIAGGDWTRIRKIIYEIFHQTDWKLMIGYWTNDFTYSQFSNHSRVCPV